MLKKLRTFLTHNKPFLKQNKTNEMINLFFLLFFLLEFCTKIGQENDKVYCLLII